MFIKSDFMTVEGNVVYNNASSAVISGISIHLAQNITGIECVRLSYHRQG